MMARSKSTLKIVCRGYVNAGPLELNAMFEPYMPVRTLRSKNHMLELPPTKKLKFSEHDIACRGCAYWNPLPLMTKQNKDLNEFKSKLKKFGLDAIGPME